MTKVRILPNNSYTGMINFDYTTVFSVKVHEHSVSIMGKELVAAGATAECFRADIEYHFGNGTAQQSAHFEIVE